MGEKEIRPAEPVGTDIGEPPEPFPTTVEKEGTGAPADSGWAPVINPEAGQGPGGMPRQ